MYTNTYKTAIMWFPMMGNITANRKSFSAKQLVGIGYCVTPRYWHIIHKPIIVTQLTTMDFMYVYTCTYKHKHALYANTV